MEVEISLFWRFKMKTSPSERKKKTERVRKERITLFNKVNNLGWNGANVYVKVEYNGKYFTSLPSLLGGPLSKVSGYPG
jgi:hypothetical protein